MGKTSGSADFRVRSVNGNRVKVWHGVVVAILVLALGFGLSYSSGVFAVTGDSSGAADSSATSSGSERLDLPEDPVDATRTVREVETSTANFTDGVDLGTRSPSGTPTVGDTSAQPVPRFSGLNTPWVVNSVGPVEVPDDSRFYGLMDVRGGLINNGPLVAMKGSAPTPPAPTVAFDAASYAPTRSTPVAAGITLTAASLNSDAATVQQATVKVYSGEGDTLTVTLNETGPNTGIFSGSVQVGRQGTEPVLGVLCPDPDVITVEYPGSGTVLASDTANTTCTGGSLAVSLAADTPAASMVPKGTTNHTATKLTLTATGSSVRVTSIKVTRTGPGSNSDLTNLQLYYYINAQQQGVLSVANLTNNTVIFDTSELALTINQGSPATLTLKADVASGATTGNTFALGIASVNDVTVESGNTVGGTFPVTGNTFTIGAPTTLTAAIASDTPGSSTATNYVAPGTNGHSATKINFTASGGNVNISQIQVKRTGTAVTGLNNIKLFDGSAQVGSTVSISGNTATFTGLSLGVNAGTTKALTVKTDVASNATGTFSFGLNTANDVTATSVATGSSVQAGGSFPINGNTFTIGSPTSLSVAIASDTPGSSTSTNYVTKGTTSHSSTKINFTASGGSVTISQIRVKRTGTSADSDLASLKLYDGSNQISSTVNLSGGFATFALSSPLTVTSGTTKVLTVKTDVASGASSNVTFVLGVNAASDVTANVSATGTFPVNGNTFTISSPTSLSVALSANTPAGSGVTKGSSDNSITTLNFTASNGAVTISTIKIVRTGTSADSDLTNLKLYDGSNQISSTVNFSGGFATFSNLSLTVTSGSTKVLTVKTGINSNATGSNFRLGVNAASDVTANVSATGSFPITGNQFTIVAPAQPDLITQSLTIPSSVMVGNSYTFSGTVKNQGTANASSTFNNRFCVDNPNCLTNTTGRVGSADNTLTSLNANTTSSTITSANWTATAGNHTIYFCADASTSVITESNESNNCSSGTFTAVSIGGGSGGYTPPPTTTRSGTSYTRSYFPTLPEFKRARRVSFLESVSNFFSPTTAKASTLIEMQGLFPPKTLRNPVTIYDDLYVYGNSVEEPGDIILEGSLYAGSTGTLRLLSPVLATDGFTALGNTQLLTLDVFRDTRVRGALTVDGTINTTTGIGTYYRVDTSQAYSDTGKKTLTATCGSDDILISCSSSWNNSDQTTDDGTEMFGRTCTGKARKAVAASRTLKVQAVCYSPSTPGTKPAGATDL